MIQIGVSVKPFVGGDPNTPAGDTDWQDVIFQTAPISNYQISATGGSEAIDYFVSTGYFKQKGILKTSEFERFNLRSNLDIPLSDKIKVGTSISGSHGIGHYPNSNGFYGRGGVISPDSIFVYSFSLLEADINCIL